jgi:hypothetical protein
MFIRANISLIFAAILIYFIYTVYTSYFYRYTLCNPLYKCIKKIEGSGFRQFPIPF